DRLAVFVLPDLQIRGICRRLYEVAGRIDLEQSQLPAPDLPAQKEGGIEGDVLGLHRLTIDRVNAPDRFADELGGSEHAGDGGKGLDLTLPLDSLLQQVHDGLRDREIAGPQ